MVVNSVVVALTGLGIGAISVVAAAPAAAAAALLCDQHTLYGINASGEVAAINVTTGAASRVVSMSPAYNGIGVSANGTDAWAFDGFRGRIVHYGADTGANTTIGAVDPRAPSNIIRGAINPATGLYYYGGSGTSAYLGAYDTQNDSKIGRIGAITGLNNANGDFAFSTLGLLFVVSGNQVLRVNGTVPTTAGNARLTTSLVATLPRGTDSPGIAFSADGYLYMSSGSTLLKLDPASGAQVGNTINLSGRFVPTDLASCNYPNTIEVRKDVVDRVNGTDQFELSVTGGSIISGNTAVTSGTANGVQSAVAGASLAIPTRSYTVSETASGTTDLANYVSTYRCVDMNTATELVSGSGTTGTFTYPAANSSDGTDVVCTFTNTPTTATLSLTKTLGGDRNTGSDQFTMAVRGASASGPVLNATTNSTTTGSGATVTAGSGTTGATSVVANRPYYLTEALAPGSGSSLAQYGSTITCIDGNSRQTGLPNGAAFTGSLAVTPVTGAAIDCTVSNRAVTPTLQVSTALGSPRYSDADQFTTSIHTGSASGPVVSDPTNSTTTGIGATVTPGSGTTGSYQAAAGTTYYVTDEASANGTRYSARITCTDSAEYQQGLPTDAPFAGAYAITPVAGAEISCVVTAAVGPAVLSLAKTNPASLTVGVPAAYNLTVTNVGGQASAAARVVDKLPPNLQYAGVSGTGWSCSATGSVAAGQLVTCTGGPIAAAATSTLSITVTVPEDAAGGTTGNRAIVDTTGGSSSGDPTTCTATGTPAGCAVAPSLPVGNGVALSLAKTNPVALTVGVGAEYSLTVTNDGTGAAETASVVDVLPANLTYHSATGASCTPSGQVLSCTVTGPIAAAGGNRTFTVAVTPSAAAASTTVVNKAAVDPSGGGTPVDPTTCAATGTPAGCAVPPSQTVVTGVGLSLLKTNPDSLTAGVAADYSMTVTNNGGTATGTATVQDVLPDDLTFNSATGASCTAVAQLLTCTVPGPIAAGGSQSFTVNVTPQSDAAGADVVNRAAVDTGGGSDPVDPTTCTGPGQPTSGCAVTPPLPVGNGVALTLAKENPAEFTVGVAADYLLTVTNSGVQAASSATLTDLLPADLTYDSASGATCSAAGQLVTCTVDGPIAALGGTASFTLSVTPTAAAGGASVANVATVDPTGGNDPVDPDTCTTIGAPIGCAQTPGLVVDSGVELSLAKTNPSSLTVGVAADYTLTVTNNGTGPASSATILDVLPDDLTFNSAAGASCAVAGGLLTCTVSGPIAAAGGTASFTVNVTPQPAVAGDQVVNKATVDVDGGGVDPGNPANCTATGDPAGCAVSPSTTVGNGVDLSLTKTNPATMTVGVPADYSLTVTNNGTGPAATATVVELLPPGLVLNSVTGATCSTAGQRLTCTVPGPFAAGGDSGTLLVNVTPTVDARGTAVRNLAIVDPTGGLEPGDPAGCIDTGTPAGCAVAPLLPVASGIDLHLTKSNPDALAVGVAADYTLTVTNNGTGPAAEATVTDLLPDNLTFVSAVGATCFADGQMLDCDVPGPIDANGGTAIFTVIVMPGAAASGTDVVNKASVDPTGGPKTANPADCTATDNPAGCAVTPAIPVAEGVLLSLSKTNPLALTVGVPAEYSFTVTNDGGAPAGSATVVDDLPAGLTFDSAAGASCATVEQLLTCTVPGPIAADGGTASFTVTVTPSPAAAGIGVVNKATVDPTGGTAPVDPSLCTGDPLPTGCAVTPATVVGTGVSLTLAKTNPPALTVGVPSSYTLQVTNSGTGPAVGATVVDVLPAGLQYVSASGASCVAELQVLTCTVPGPVAPLGGSQLFTVTVLPLSGSDGVPMVNRAAVDPTGGSEPVDPAECVDTNSLDGCAVTPPLTPGRAGLTLLKTATLLGIPGQTQAVVGDQIAYEFAVSNAGNAALTDVVVLDPKVGTVSCPSTSLAAGESLTCTSANYTVTQADVDAGSVVNTATAAGTPAGCLASDCQVLAPPSLATTMTLSIAGVDASKSGELLGAGEARSGGTIRYSVTVTNTGTVTIDNFVVNDPMLTLECPQRTVAPGASVQCTGDHRITDADAAAGRLVNTAVVTANGAGGQTVQHTTNTVIDVVHQQHPPLPYTGIPGREMVLVAVLLLIGGLTFIALGRRRQHG